MTEEKKKAKPIKPISEVKLRSYPKVIFFYPLLFISLVLWPIQLVIGPLSPAAEWLGAIWMIIFFTNLFVIAFDFSSAKFFILALVIVVVILLLIFLVAPYTGLKWLLAIDLDLILPWQFYMTIFLILFFILIWVLLGALFDYYKIERNEIYHKKGLFAESERFPVKSLRMKKEIPDVFEFFILRAGSITLMPGKAEEVINLKTVLNINKKAEQIDYLLSHISVEPDELDTV